MNILPFDKQIAAISALTEGISIRATERLTGIHRDTIMRLGARVGEGCAALHDLAMRDLHVSLLQLDELWAYVGKKQCRAKPGETDKGDQYTDLALDSTNKAIVSYLTGKQTAENTRAFAHDLYSRVLNVPQVTSDGMEQYIPPIEEAFGLDCDYAQIVKSYVGEPGPTAARRYSPGYVVGVSRTRVLGNPDQSKISTSHVERANLSVRMGSRRFTRLSNGFSKKLSNHETAVSLFVAHYNFCRVHETLRITPAMVVGVTDHIWTIGELVEVATAETAPEPTAPQSGPFRVIDGGLSDSKDSRN